MFKHVLRYKMKSKYLQKINKNLGRSFQSDSFCKLIKNCIKRYDKTVSIEI